ncbi:MAG: peroxisome- protein [Bathelium mastoideum]|nr:MAG: peroxisome- protein [Bathelium mastoideum]KAI9689988.1 MAG: peroxisome- protein [Bathelium mastoideum]
MSSVASSSAAGASALHDTTEPTPPTVAAFSPATTSHSPDAVKQRSTIVVYQKSPLLVSTPPQITRALAYSHPFLIPLNKIVGLLSWTTGDPWESFLMVAAFWAVTLYGDVMITWAGPLILVVGLIFGMYSRRYSPLSSTGWSNEKLSKKKQKQTAAALEGATNHHKSLDEIVDILRIFTSRCSILLDPFLRLTDFLSTQRTATSATTRPALTTLFIRILLVTPVWVLLSLPPISVITARRIVLTFGTLTLSWHSRPARVSRTILWRSRSIRRLCSIATGLSFGEPSKRDALQDKASARKTPNEVASSLAAKRSLNTARIRFTFTLYENQRRWLGIGWTASMLAYERAPWTDEHLNPMPSKEQFELPEVEGGLAKWRWVEGSEWRIEGAESLSDPQDVLRRANAEQEGWIFYDNKWRDGRRGQDSWGRYTRRRKWHRDAELVDASPSQSPSPPNPSTALASASIPDTSAEEVPTPTPTSPSFSTATTTAAPIDDTASDASPTRPRRRRWFSRGGGRAESEASTALGSTSGRSGSGSGSTSTAETAVAGREGTEQDVYTPLRHEERESEWGVGEELKVGLG